MKPVLEVVKDKNGEETIHFNPTPLMQLFAIEKAKNPGLGDREVAEHAGIDPQNPGRWACKYGSHYLTWLEEATESAVVGKEAVLLERVGMMQALQRNNYSYWKDLAKKYGVIKEEVKEQNLTIVDFGGASFADLEGLRSQILREVMGVGSASEAIAVEATKVETSVVVNGHEKQEGDRDYIHGVPALNRTRKRKIPPSV